MILYTNINTIQYNVNVNQKESVYLRTYPVDFGKKIGELFPDLVTGGEGKPSPTDLQHMTDDGCKIFYNLPWETWSDAKLMGPIRYMRGNMSLAAPTEWVSVFPEPFEALHRLESRQNSSKA